MPTDKALRFSALEAICQAPDCQPGDILEYKQIVALGLIIKCRELTSGILLYLLNF
ncbi:helix-turn-helix domain-containing protein [Mucilaginibacter sp.]|uniref:helix-turn-helix domain-containing protein n=1 Tax=Mucilaginibacter sp. TaxID=1882438 RepID=UPI002D8035CC|nr:helix-turn-helix domain-containing protein [Mucilaginibacter sp.]